MFSRHSIASLLVASSCLAVNAQSEFAGIGREATGEELAAWDIDVRADFEGLPNGEGKATKGRKLYEQKCASCHGLTGTSSALFTPIVGGTTSDDILEGRVAALEKSSPSNRTTFMKLSTLSTLFDYIRRAMPWEAPKSLTDPEVYAITAYLLHLEGIVPANFTLSHDNAAAIQERLPNRLGMTTNHGLWLGDDAQVGGFGNGGIPDIDALRCMTNCVNGQ